MKIILTQNVPNLGSLGDEVQVKDGYARNFLLPKGMAMPASGRNAKALQHHRQFLEKQRAEAITKAQGEAGLVEALELTVKAKAGTGGKLFGSVTNRDLQALLAEQGYEVDRKSIALHTPVKSLGTFAATVKLHTDVKVELQFKVEASEVVAAPPPGKGEEGAAAAEGGQEAAAPDAEASGEGEGAPAPESSAEGDTAADAPGEDSAGDSAQAPGKSPAESPAETTEPTQGS